MNPMQKSIIMIAICLCTNVFDSLNNSSALDPIPQIKLAGAGLTEGNLFGCSSAISGDTLIIGARGDGDYGSAHIYQKSGNNWIRKTRFSASQPFGDFGFAASISGNTVVVGAPRESGFGAVYVYTLANGKWIREAILAAPDKAKDDGFGISVSISGDSILVGAYGDEGDFGIGVNCGSAYVYTRENSIWRFQTKLTASDAFTRSLFGNSVSICSDIALVGAYYDDDNGPYSGSAYVFVRNGNTWTQQAKLLAVDGGEDDYFGTSVSVSGGTVIVGAYYDASTAFASGSAYIFRRNGTSWIQEAKLTPSDATSRRFFGYSVSISGNSAIVGAYGDETMTNGSGSAYIFKRDNMEWTELTKFRPQNDLFVYQFGWSVGIDGQQTVVGAPYSDNPEEMSGAAYVFDFGSDELPSNTYFSINTGAAFTNDTTVTLNNTFTNAPDQYMASESPDFAGASWQTYTIAPRFRLSSTCGSKAVYLKVKNSKGESAVVNDNITLLEPAAVMKSWILFE